MTAIDTRASTIVSLYTTAIYQHYSPPIIAVLTTPVHRLSNLSTNRYMPLHDTRSTGTNGPSHVLAADDGDDDGDNDGDDDWDYDRDDDGDDDGDYDRDDDGDDDGDDDEDDDGNDDGDDDEDDDEDDDGDDEGDVDPFT